MHRDKRSLFLSLLGLSIIFSQPFIYGGESRTSASLIMYYSLIIFNILTFVKLSFNYKSINSKLSNNMSCLKRIINERVIVLYSNFALALLFFIILIAIFAPKFEPTKIAADSYCPDNKKKINIAFHSASGFNLSKDLNKVSLKNSYGIDHFLNVLSNQIIMLNSYRPLSINLPYLSKDDIKNRDRFLWLTRLFSLSTPRVYGLDDFMLNNYIDLFSVFSQGGGFFIKPFNLDDESEIGMIVIPTEMIKNGINNLPICKTK